jgi:hypothetical protein
MDHIDRVLTQKGKNFIRTLARIFHAPVKNAG